MIVNKPIDNYTKLLWLTHFMEGHKGFICGGCFKNIFNNEKVKDLDIFFHSRSDWEDAVHYFDTMTSGYELDDVREEKYHFLYENNNVKAYKHIKTGIQIELCNKIFGTPEEIIKQFDFTIVKFALYSETEEVRIDTDIFEILEPVTTFKVAMDNNFFEHLHEKRLVIDEDILFPISTFERTIRYAKYGYFPCRETKKKLVRAIWDVEEDELDVSKSLYDGMD